LKIIGITGASGAGKTTVSNIIKQKYNAKVIDADKIAKELSKSGTEYFKEIVEYFGTEILQKTVNNVGTLPTGDLQIDRKKLANIIFNDASERTALNKITEKHVVKKINQKIEEYSKTEEIIILDVPLLFESGLDRKCNITIGVIADENLKIQRICKRDGIDKDLAKQRINALKDDEFLIKNCTNIITNEGDEEALKEQIELTFNEQIVYNNNGKIKYLQFKKLLEYPELTHAFVIKPLDFKNAETSTLLENYEQILKELKIDKKEIVKPYQTHTDNIYNVIDESGIHVEELKDVDGLITKSHNKALSLVFADCMPIYLYDPIEKVIANLHSGWKGTLKQISKKAVQEMKKKYGSNVENIICVLGPTIRKCHFEVEEDVYSLFENEFKYMVEWKNIVEKYPAGKYKIDTILINKILLKEAGLKEENIIDSNLCTVCSRKVMHSYRTEKEKSRKKYQYYIFKIIKGEKYVPNI